ncbi:aldose 1-epimerase family protein [candidate division KSB1 bacterium]|nr:aldose 1-epimerase family protein [candidate division KSB1 bacterium]NIV70785.1 DUF4432 family protein [Phycisphaerae bacterium]NIR72904.1 aldose 1-epimerase family protein [candidate division KSB1 bacterium]NIT73702.1 aldose 1-epimerase family protein [candidate division KSB1 bacterium]NIU27574.1 aldose 1-epimerase family protein [candidate division KSB1 bacterium]
MCKLFGENWKREHLLRHVGDIRQIADVRLSELSDGPGRGVRIADFKTGSGFAFTVLIDRGMDIGEATYNGIPLAFRSPIGVKHSCYYEPQNSGWLRNFHGGWLITCGLTNVGVSGKDELGSYEMHGRASNLPATLISYGGRWQDDEYELWLEASIRETSFFGFDIQLTRRFSARLGESYLKIVDKIENLSERESPFMLLYHCNFGFPLVSADSRLVLSQSSVQPRDDNAKKAIENHLVMEVPQRGFAEQVFFHDLNTDGQGYATAAVVNEDLDLAGFVSFQKHELPNFIEWKQMGSKEYVLGLEPANCLVMGREQERQRGTLQMLQPGEVRETMLYLGVMSGKMNITKLVNTIQTQNPVLLHTVK